jgi:DNA-damage-inducible protein D
MADARDEAKEKLMPKDVPMSEIVKLAAPLMPKQDAPDDGPPVQEGDGQLVLFEGFQIRQQFHNNEWFFSVIDVISAITGSAQPSRYWTELKKQLHENEGFDELFGKIEQLRMESSDGKHYLTDAVNVETLLRVVQSIPHKKAEPFKRWLAQVGYERIQETHDPEIAVKRAILSWQAQGRTSDWIEARLRSIVVRGELTDQWQRTGVEKGWQYGALTNVISSETFGLDTNQHKQLKGLNKQNLRDHMTDLELVLTMLGEKSTTAIAVATRAQGYRGNVVAAKSGGRVAGDARRGLERQLGQSVVSRDNFLNTSRKKDPQRLTQPNQSDKK